MRALRCALTLSGTYAMPGRPEEHRRIVLSLELRARPGALARGAMDVEGTIEADYHEFLGASSFWCVCTQKAFGPDGDPVNARDCVKGRKCCE